MGSLGFLTSFTVEELYPALENVLAGRATINERVLLLVERVNAGQIVTQQRVLNDAVVHKGTLARMIELELFIDEGFVCRYRAFERTDLSVAHADGRSASACPAGVMSMDPPPVESIGHAGGT